MIMTNRGANSNVITKITEDLIIEIFLRLPEKSISRFLCLSKQWKSIILSKYFIDLFRSMSPFKHLLVFRERDDELDWKLFSSHQPLSSSPVADSFVHAKFSEYHISYKSYFEGSHASGLIYFFGDGEGHGICNPSTREYMIPPPIKHFSCFLGFDPIGKQFKVLLCIEKRDDEVVYHASTLGTENERQREMKCPLTYDYLHSDHICINGVYYYETHDGSIGCFDVRSEKILKFKCPVVFNKFVNYKGKLGLSYIDVYDSDYTDYYYLDITIWVLEDFNTLEWRKHVYKVRDHLPEIANSTRGNLCVIGVTDSGDIILGKTFARKPFYVYFFNPSDSWRLRPVQMEGFGEEEKKSDYNIYRIHYLMNHEANFGFDIMKKTTYAETCLYEQAKTEASTSSSNDN